MLYSASLRFKLEKFANFCKFVILFAANHRRKPREKIGPLLLLLSQMLKQVGVALAPGYQCTSFLLSIPTSGRHSSISD